MPETNTGTRGRLNISKNSKGYSYDFTLELSSSIASRETLENVKLELQGAARTYKNELEDMIRQFKLDDIRSAR